MRYPAAGCRLLCKVQKSSVAWRNPGGTLVFPLPGPQFSETLCLKQDIGTPPPLPFPLISHLSVVKLGFYTVGSTPCQLELPYNTRGAIPDPRMCLGDSYACVMWLDGWMKDHHACRNCGVTRSDH